MGIAFVAAVYDAIRHHDTLFAEPMTADSRGRLLRLTVFALLPLSIIFHEAGHAVAVKIFGGEIVDFGFYFIYGFVSHRGFYSALDLGWIALAGTIVNVILGIIAIAIFWFWPRRAPVNYLLITFAALQGANALIFYPVLDLMGGIVGDWSTIYSSDTPVFSTVVGVIHAGILIGSVVIWKSEWFQRGYSERLGQPYRTPEQAARRSELARIIARAASEAAGDWRHPVELVADAQAGGIQMVMRWNSDNFNRALLVHASPMDGADPHVEIHAAVRPEDPGIPPHQRAIERIDGEPNVDELAQHITRALDLVDRWDGATITSAN